MAGLVVRVVVDATQAEPAADKAVFGIAIIETKTAIVSKLHKRRRVLSGLPAKSMFAAAASVLTLAEQNLELRQYRRAHAVGADFRHAG